MVCDHDHRQPLRLEQAAQQVQDGAAGFGIEISGGFIREQEGGAVGQSAGNRLFLTAGKFVEPGGASAAQGRRFRQGPCGTAPRASGNVGEHQGASTFSTALNVGSKLKL